MSELERILAKMVEAPEGFAEKIPNIEKGIYKELLSLVQELKTDSSGRVIASVENIKKVSALKLKLNKIVLSKEYLTSVKGFGEKF